ncbi:hypothetical protein [Chryseobacterium sp. M5A1_1a]
MKNFQELKEKRPELAIMLESMTKDEILEHYAIEVFEKDVLEEDKENMEFYHTELEYIISLAFKWLKKNRKDKHQIIIELDKAKLIYINEERNFI